MTGKNQLARKQQQITTPGRRLPPTSLLWAWVDAEVKEQMRAQQVFTAYSISKILRAQHPDYEIQHFLVQERVHERMPSINHYVMTWQVWNGEAARTYAPLVVVSRSATAGGRANLLAQSVRIQWDDEGA